MKNNKQGFAAVFGIIIVLVLLGGSVYLYSQKPVAGPVACTMEAKLCPDGSSVGRTGPNCEFAACPGASPVSPDNSFTTKPAPVVDETKDWKTYKNEKYGFEFKYPETWISRANEMELSLQDNPAGAMLNLWSNKNDLVLQKMPVLAISLIPRAGDLEKMKTEFDQYGTGSFFVNVGGEKAIKTILQGNSFENSPDDPNISGVKLIFSNKNKTIDLTLTTGSSSDLTNQILSTFRFTK